jgi:5,6-dimethylbenzimidazole synthase
MDFSELLVKRRSIRNDEEREVALETIRGIIRESCLAPSSGNGQPWKFIVVHSSERSRKTSEERTPDPQNNNPKNLHHGLQTLRHGLLRIRP